MKKGKKTLFFVTIIFVLCILAGNIGVTQAASKVKLNKTKLMLTVGQKSTLKVKGTKKKVKWTSSNKKVATVTSKGVVKAKKKGTATITATVAKKKYKCKITVKKARKPKATPTPKVTSKPKATPTPKITSTPKITPTPTTTPTPEATLTPTTTPTPEATLTPTTTPTPEATSTPTVTPTPEATSTPTVTPTSTAAPDGNGASTVYMTEDISPSGLMKVYEALGTKLSGNNIAVKLSTGEPPASNYLDPDLIKDLVQEVDGTIVECNTAYGGSRAETAMHYQVAEDHGFADLGKGFVIMDEDGSMSLPVEGGQRLSENLVGAHFGDFDGFLVLSHFKGHAMAGFGGAIKNISIGIGSREGKCLIHTAGRSHTSPWGGDQDAFLESMADAGKSVVDALDGNILFINVMNRLSIDCDCDGNPAEPDIHDIGILASTDPVALDKACLDLIYKADGKESFVRRVEGQNGAHVLEAGEAIGLGSTKYELKSID